SSLDPYLASNIWITVHRTNADATVGNDAAYMIDCASQMVKVTNINTSNKTITFTPALNESYPSDSVSISISSPYRCGLQDFYIENKNDNGGHNINLVAAHECWVKNVESNMASHWHIRLQASSGCEVRECYVHDGYNGGGDTIYGVGLFQYSCN